MHLKMAIYSRRAGKEGAHGIALILVMLSMLILSVLAAAIVFAARSETLASHSFKLDTQADYLAKAGIQQAINWFRSTHYQGVPEPQAITYYNVTSTGVPYNLYTANSEPVQCIGTSPLCPAINNPVQLIGYGSGSTNYPNINNNENAPRPVATAFGTDLVSVRVTGDAGNSGTFSINAYLISYQTVNLGQAPPYTRVPVETWRITSKASWNASSSSNATMATAEEQVVLQPIYLPNWGNALYGFCSVSMTGSTGTCTDAFNSALGQYGGGMVSVAAGACDSNATNVIDAGAGVGANGGVTLGSNVSVSGNVTVGVGPSSGCAASGFSGNAGSVQGQVVNGPNKPAPPVATFRPSFPGSAPSYSSRTILPVNALWPAMPPFPGVIPSPGSNTPPVMDGSGNAIHQPCSDSSCDGTAAHPFEINALSPTGNGTQVQLVGSPDPFNPVVYNIDSVSEASKAEIDVSGYVVLNVRTSISISGNGVTNGISGTVDIPPEAVVINYAGTTGVTIHGNGALSALINAPNANVTFGGGGSSGYFVGAVQANNISVAGGYPVHYDIQLSRSGGTTSVPVITGFSRKKM